MKKNLFFGLMALAGLFTSCSQDDAYAPPAADNNQVSMSIGMPADFVKTRAAAPSKFPANHQLRCILEVWTQDGSTRKIRQEKVVEEDAANITFNFELADQGDYKAVLWANYIGGTATESDGHYPDKYYKTDDEAGLKKVSIITNDYSYTDQAREAFTAVKTFTKGASAKTDLAATLVRPLTKVTIAEKNAEMFNKCTSMTAAYTVPSEFNAFSEEVSTTATYNVTYSAGPMGGTDISINGNLCKILFSDYVFTVADATLGGIELTFNGNVALNARSIPANIPLKRNNWVRAAGNLITAAAGGYDPAVALSVDMTTQWVEHNATDIPDAVTEAKVGDFYYADGTWSSTYTSDALNPCIGIVFEVNADGKSGKIVSLDEANLAWSTVQKETGISNTTDGAANMTAVQTWIASDANTDHNTLTDFPAFNWCINKNDGARTWYLPAAAELKILAKNTENVNTALATLSKPTLVTNESCRYWSSHEGGSSSKQYNAICLDFRVGYEASRTKTEEERVRAISVF